ncbi:hypothetical protein [Mycetocola saprophilus]|uniref:hypothetical protein n=1 Tax=Mycetocola saprophilus TaxID=76636 RepID=UPI003BF42088
MNTPNNTDIDPRLKELSAAIYGEEEHAGLELGTSAAWELYCAYSKLIAVTIGDSGRCFQKDAPVILPDAETPGPPTPWESKPSSTNFSWTQSRSVFPTSKTKEPARVVVSPSEVTTRPVPPAGGTSGTRVGGRSPYLSPINHVGPTRENDDHAYPAVHAWVWVSAVERQK